MSDKIHIAYCLNDNYAEPTCVSMASILANTQANVCFHVAYNKLSAENKNNITGIGKTFANAQWSFYYLDTKDYEYRFTSVKGSYVSAEAYFRLFFPPLIKNTERIIYLDGDTVVTGDIASLWNEDLKGKALGAVRNITNSGLRPEGVFSDIMGFDIARFYFNSGVLLIDLAKYIELFEINVVFQTIDYMRNEIENRKLLSYHDQDTLNYIANNSNNVTLLSPRYNLQQKDFDYYTFHQSYAVGFDTLTEWRYCNKDHIILHFIGPVKPWQHKNKIKYLPDNIIQSYFTYKTLTPYKNSNDTAELSEYTRRLHFTKTEALLCANIYMICFWREVFERAAKKVSELINGRRLVIFGCGNHIKHILTIFALNNLSPAMIVDRFCEKQGKRVFEYETQAPEPVKNGSDTYFIIITDATLTSANMTIDILNEYGYTEADYLTVYEEAFRYEERKPAIL